MRKIRKIAFGLSFLMVLCTFGCGKSVSSAKIVRDDLRVGGTLSFVYDKNSREIFVGGEDEVFQYSAKNEEKGFDEGNRFGLKVIAPDEKFDLKNAKLEMGGVSYLSEDFLEVIDGQIQRFFYIYPSFSKDNRKVTFAIVWDDKTQKQEYKIIVVDGTRFMDKNGEIV